MPYANFTPILKELRSSSFEGTMVSGLNEILLLNQRNEYNFTFNFCKERIVGIPIVVYFRKNFFLILSINAVIRNLVSAGIIEHLHKNYLDEKRLSVIKSFPGLKVLTLEHLQGCFELWAAGCAFSFAFFLAELSFAFVKSKKASQKLRRKLVQPKSSIYKCV
jgi:hypothetical protein